MIPPTSRHGRGAPDRYDRRAVIYLSRILRFSLVMVLIVAFGVLVDRLAFGIIERRVLAKRGLAPP